MRRSSIPGFQQQQFRLGALPPGLRPSRPGFPIGVGPNQQEPRPARARQSSSSRSLPPQGTPPRRAGLKREPRPLRQSPPCSPSALLLRLMRVRTPRGPTVRGQGTPSASARGHPHDLGVWGEAIDGLLGGPPRSSITGHLIVLVGLGGGVTKTWKHVDKKGRLIYYGLRRGLPAVVQTSAARWRIETGQRVQNALHFIAYNGVADTRSRCS